MAYMTMTNSVKRFTGLALASVMLVGAVSAPAMAQDAATEGRQFGSKAGAIVNEALTFMNGNQTGAAISKLNEALTLELNAYEKSTCYQMLGSAYYEQENYPQAISNFENAINSGGLLQKETTSLRLNIAQLLIASGRNSEGATMLENYINQGNTVKPQYIDMLVGAWVQAEDYRRALPWAEKWFRSANPKERKHFDLLNFLYNNLGMTAKQADIVMQMLVRFPEDRTLWDTWASMLSNGGREEDAFEVKKMLYLGGAANSESDLNQVVQYYSYYDMPYQAAQILEREMNAGKIAKTTDKLVQLSDLLRQAREYKRAIPILEQAAGSAGSGKVYAQLGEAYYNNKQCDKAEGAFKQAISLGFGKGKAWMQVGTCRYEESGGLDRIDCKMSDEQIAAAPRTVMRNRASEAFSNVPAGSSQGSAAVKWRQFIKAEEQAVKNRCIFELNVEKEVCFQDIGNAYKAKVFTGGDLKLTDENCGQFVSEYETIYIVKKTDG